MYQKPYLSPNSCMRKREKRTPMLLWPVLAVFLFSNSMLMVLCVNPLNELLNGPPESTLNEVDTQCPVEMFPCDSGKCIPRLYVCDGEKDCKDGADEGDHCRNKKKSCEDMEFDCGDGKCIPTQWVCDSEVDCKDTGLDEEPDTCNNFECKSDEFTCQSFQNGTRCIPLNWVCDNKRDCEDGSDEFSCSVSCTPEQYSCASGVCIPLMWRCDGSPDCDDESDEQECPKEECGAHEVKCNDGSCIQKAWVCDGSHDCTDGGDEVAVCDNGDCISKTWLCDGELDCLDESDEKNCTADAIPFTCADDEILCLKTPICIKKGYLCDGDKDCPDGYDESDKFCASKQCPKDSFTCGDTSCISKDLVCNGFTECVDGSDEKNCPAPKCDPQLEFDCGDRCISSSLVCNGQDDCGNGKDELEGDLCARDECKEHNGGCSQLCVNTRAGYYCSCRLGFMLVGKTQCEDINECMEPGVCSQLCINLKGSYKCDCVAGYVKDPNDPRRCKATEGHASLLFAGSYDIRKISLDHNEATSIIDETNGAAALDFVFKTGMIFWTDTKDRCIYKAPIDEGQKKEVVIKNDQTNTDGLSVDWIYNHIYWTNSDTNTIHVSDFDGRMQKTLFTDRISEPRAIALYPMEGWIFWTDWGSEAKIERAGMDGTNRQAIVTRDIRWPNGLTLDLVLRRVIWVDSKRHTISACDFDGSNRRVILHTKEHLPHPFSITVFEDNMYWTDWTKGAVLSADKFSGRDVRVITKVHSNPMTVHVYHSYRQPNGTNHCTPLNGLCTHLCLPAPQISPVSPKISCACPDGHKLMPNGLTCAKIGSPDPPMLPETYPESPSVSFRSSSSLTRELVDSFNEKHIAKPNQDMEKMVKDAAMFGDRTGDNRDESSVAVAAILAAIVVLCLTSGFAYVVYRYYRKHAAQSMNFDNPIYKKTTTEDGFNMSHGSQNGGSRCPHSPFHNRQYSVMPSEEAMEPLTGHRNHYV